MELVVSRLVGTKIREKHGVEVAEVEEAFFLLGNGYLIKDSRAKNKTNPATVWFISETLAGRLLKVVIIPFFNEDYAVLRTAYEPDDEEIAYYAAVSEEDDS